MADKMCLWDHIYRYVYAFASFIYGSSYIYGHSYVYESCVSCIYFYKSCISHIHIYVYQSYISQSYIYSRLGQNLEFPMSAQNLSPHLI